MWLIRIISRMPLGLLYVLSDVVFFFLYFVVRYRRKVVYSNLRSCFPEKSEKEIGRIARRFYRNFSDYFVETVKLPGISDEEMRRRFVFEGVSIMDDALARGRDVVVYFSHCGNWEWATSVRLWSRYSNDPKILFGQIYRPLRNIRFDSLMLKIRSRFETLCIPKARALRDFLVCRRDGRRFEVGFMSDQKPSHGDPEKILSFFGRPTAVITGTETLARRLDTAVVYWDITKTSRGHYRINVIPMTDAASTVPEGQLTLEYFRLLERTITLQPEIWLWTHKRWKTSPKSWTDVKPQTLLRHE